MAVSETKKFDNVFCWTSRPKYTNGPLTQIQRTCKVVTETCSGVRARLGRRGLTSAPVREMFFPNNFKSPFLENGNDRAGPNKCTGARNVFPPTISASPFLENGNVRMGWWGC